MQNLHPVLRAALAPLLPPEQRAAALAAIKPPTLKAFRIDYRDELGYSAHKTVHAASSMDAVTDFKEANPSARWVMCRLASDVELGELARIEALHPARKW